MTEADWNQAPTAARHPQGSRHGSRHPQTYSEPSRAVAVFVLGLLGFLVMPLLAPFAWAMGSRELAAIDAGLRPPNDRGLARIGQVLGIAMSSLLILIVVFIVGLAIFSFLRLAGP